MNDAQRVEFDARRDLSDKAVPSACYAPFTSMYLDPRGEVLACCENTDHPLGNISDTPLLEIWRGPRTAALRESLRAYDLGLGCKFCKWQIDDGNYDSTLTNSFAHLAVTDPSPAWPTRLEFAMSNTCNLECAMCNGEWSSTIRARREGRPPLPKVYDDAFFEDLRAFLPHLSEVHFLGGEPLLAHETLRVMDLIVDAGLQIGCQVTTNGTQWNARVERILARLPVSLAVSLDGVTRETVESLRVGASFETLMANLAHFRDYTRNEGSSLSLTFCLMQQNWHEFGDYLRFADEWGCRVYVNTVMNPAFSLHHLPPDDFAAVVRAFEAQDDDLRAQLTLNHDLWVSELERLRSWRARAPAPAGRASPGAVRVDDPAGAGSRGPLYFHPGPLPDSLRHGDAEAAPVSEPLAVERTREGMDGGEVSLLRCDPDGQIISVDAPHGNAGTGFMGLPTLECVELQWDQLAARLGRIHGNETYVVSEDLVGGGILRLVVLGRPRIKATYAQVFSYPERTPDGVVGSVTVACWSHAPPAWAPAIG